MSDEWRVLSRVELFRLLRRWRRERETLIAEAEAWWLARWRGLSPD